MTSFLSRAVASPIGRNVVFLSLSGAAKGLSSIAFVLIALASLEVDAAGQVILAFLLVRIAQNVAGAGLSRYLARESAHDPASATGLALGVIKLLATLTPLGLLAAAVAALVEPRLGLAIAFCAVAGIAGSTQQALGGAFLARERTYLDSICEVLAAALLCSGALLAALLDLGPLAYVGTIAVSRFAACGLALALFGAAFRPELSLREASAVRAFQSGLPYMLNAGASFAFLRADILLLGLLSGTRAVSIYGGVADPIVTVAATVHIMNTAFLPGLSRADADRSALARRMMVLNFVLGFALAGIVFAGAGPFTNAVLDADKSDSADVLRFLSVILVLRFVSNGLATWLTAAGLQWRRTAIAIAAGVFNISVNLVAIPIWGYWAAVVTTLATEGLILVLSFVALRPELTGHTEPVAGKAPATGLPAEGFIVGQE